VQLNYATGDASMGPFDLSNPEYTARVPLIQLDFSQTPGYSDLDVRSIDAGVDATYRFASNLLVRGAYRYVEFDDAAPYLYDTSGKNNLVYFSIGYDF
jgi:hypothetical protein